MTVAASEDLVHDIAVIGEKYETGRIFIQSAYGENAFFMIDVVDDIVIDTSVGGAYDTDRFIECDKYELVFGFNGLSVKTNCLSFKYPSTESGLYTVNSDPAFFDDRIRFTSRTDTAVGKVLIYPYA